MTSGVYRPKQLQRSEVYCHRKSARIPPKAGKTQRHSETKRKNQTVRYSLYLGQAGTAMYQTGHRANLRSEIQRQQLRLSPEPFRGTRRAENLHHASTHNLHYVIEFDIKGFFDNVNHSKLMRQIWAMGIHDKQLIFIIKRILKAPIRMPDGTTLIPDKGTPQGGIISPLLANIVLNELDKWVESQWQNHPLVKEYGYERKIRNSITFDRSKAFLKMRKTG